MHKASRPMYLSDITIQLSGAKSLSRVHNQYKLYFCVYVYCHALTYPNSNCYIMQKSREHQSFIWLKFSRTSTTLVHYYFLLDLNTFPQLSICLNNHFSYYVAVF